MFDNFLKLSYNFFMNKFERTEQLIGKDNFKKLQNSKVIVFGVGGVGGYVVENLVRSGINTLCIVDFDKVNITNLNRQIIALNSTINMFKVDAFKSRILDINENINLTCFKDKVCAENIEKFNLNSYDYVIDCIDSFKDKLALIDYCYKNKINIVSSMGAGNRFKMANFDVCDVFSTKNDALARKLRVELKKLGVKKLDVVCSNTVSDNLEDKSKVLSISYMPSLCGIKLASFVINKLIEN